MGDDYEVKTILAHREDRDGIRYLVQWSNYQIEDSTWVHADKCGDAQEKIQDYHDRVLRMTTYNAHGDTSALDYMQLASIIQPRTDDYLYQTQKADDYAQHCGSTAPQSVLSSVGGSWARSTPHPQSDPQVQYKKDCGSTFSPCLCKHTFGDDKLSTRDDLTGHLHRYGSQEVSQEE